MYNIGSNVSNKQKQLIDKYVELINYKIEKNLEGRKFTNLIGSLMENALRKMVQEQLKNTETRAEKCFVKDNEGGFTEHDIVLFRKGRENQEMSEIFNTLVVDSKDVEAIVEVKSFADTTGLNQFTNFLRQCNLVERGYFVGIAGSIKGVNRGVDVNKRPRIFILAKFSGYANIKRKQRMQKDKVKDNPGVLEQFLKTMQEELVNIRSL